MMHRALCRVFRGTCRKWRDDCPVAVGEEVSRKNNKEQNDKEQFVLPKHSWEEAVTWTAGLVLAYQLTHKSGRRQALTDDCVPSQGNSGEASGLRNTSQKLCPFSLAAKACSQPVFGVSTALSINRTSVIPSVTPFLHDDIQEVELPERLNLPSVVEDEDIVFASDADLSKPTANQKKQSDEAYSEVIKDPKEYGRKYAGDLLSVLGAFEFMRVEGEAKPPQTRKKRTRNKSRKKSNSGSSIPEDTPMHALELMKKGSELGSERALYNIGVAYERMNEIKLAREYYKKAADLGHPLAMYNCAVFALKDGHLAEGVALMKMASDFGVPEATKFMKPSADTLTAPLEVGGKA